jgi:hypothetical protein
MVEKKYIPHENNVEKKFGRTGKIRIGKLVGGLLR